MGNCLVTKLKSVVNDDSLEVLGELKTKEFTINDSWKFTIISNGNMTIKTTNGVLFNWELGSNRGVASSIDVPAKTNVTIESPSTAQTPYRLIFTDKYDIYYFNAYVDDEVCLEDFEFIPIQTLLFGRNYSGYGDIKAFRNNQSLISLYLRGYSYGDIENLNNISTITDLRFFGTQCSGNIQSLSSLTTLENLYLFNNPGIYGNIQDLCSLVNLTLVDIGQSNIAGSVEEYVASLIAHGKSSGSIKYNFLLNGKVSFGGEIYTPASERQKLEYTSSSKINVFVGDDGTYTTFHTVYAKGATAQEISAWTQQGMTVIEVA